MTPISQEIKSFIDVQPYWSIKEVSRYTGYKLGTLYNLTSRNLIPHRKKRGKVYFVPLEIQNWIDEGNL